MVVRNTAKRVVIEGLGWILVVVGIAALVLPGPGLLALFAGVALLATQYEWAERRLEPVKKAALRGAADSVKSWPRILLSFLGVCWLIALGVYWGISPPAPSWWPVDDRWWLAGGWGTGATLIGSGIIAGAMVVYSYVYFRDIKDEQHEEQDQAQEPAGTA
ncbi:MAG: PGPGW domain-containing protein [Marmoricola sp.]